MTERHPRGEADTSRDAEAADVPRRAGKYTFVNAQIFDGYRLLEPIPVTIAAMLLGVHVRVGTEDAVWRYPHRNEVVTDSREMVERVRITAERLGRELATPAEARALLGLPAREVAPVSS
jgi:hypothetical protein